MKLTAEHIRAQEFRVILGESAVLLGPDGRRYHPHHKCMIGVEWHPAHKAAGLLLDALQAELEAEIQADKQTKREQLKDSMKRTGTRGGPAGDRLNLKGREFVTPVKKF